MSGCLSCRFHPGLRRPSWSRRPPPSRLAATRTAARTSRSWRAIAHRGARWRRRRRTAGGLDSPAPSISAVREQNCRPSLPAIGRGVPEFHGQLPVANQLSGDRGRGRAIRAQIHGDRQRRDAAAPLPPTASAGRELAAERGHRRVDNPVVTPAEHGIGEPGRRPHRPLHHLDRPRRRRERAATLLGQFQPSAAFEVAVHGGIDQRWSNAALQLDPDAHAIRQRWRHHTGKDRSRLKTPAVQTEVAEPAPPPFELPSPLDRPPHRVWRSPEPKRPPVVDDRRPGTHPPQARGSPLGRGGSVDRAWSVLGGPPRARWPPWTRRTSARSDRPSRRRSGRPSRR